MKRILELFQTLSRPNQAIIVGGFVVMIMLAVGIPSLISHYKDRAFERKQAEYEKQLDVLKSEREAAITRAQMFEAQAKEAEAKSAINEAIANAAGAKAKAAKEELANEDKKYQDEISSIDDDVDSCTRLKRICERAKQLKLYPATKVCACEESPD